MVTVMADGFEGYQYIVGSKRARSKRENDCYELTCVRGPDEDALGSTAVVQGRRLRKSEFGSAP